MGKESSRRKFLKGPAGLALTGAAGSVARAVAEPWQSRAKAGASADAAKAKKSRAKPHVNVGTLGQLGHGKTTLASAITRMLSEQLALVKFRSFESLQPQQNKDRGVPIAMTILEYETVTRHYAHADCATDVDHVKNLVAGALRLNGAILVVAANEGITAQTKEQVRLARQAGVGAVAVALNKADLGNEAALKQLETDVRTLLSGNGYRDTPIVRVSATGALKGDARWKRAVMDLMNAVDKRIPLPPRAQDQPFLMPVEDVFGIAGRGGMVTGRVERGVVRIGDRLAILGMRESQEAVVTGVEAFRKPLTEAQVGNNIGILLKGVTREMVERGQVLAQPGSIAARTRLAAEIYLFTREEGGRQTPIGQGYRPQIYLRTTDVTGTVRLPQGRERVSPGEHLPVEIELVRPMALEKQQRFAIREGGRSVGAGVVVSVL